VRGWLVPQAQAPWHMLGLVSSSGLHASHAMFPPGMLPRLGYLGTAGVAGGIWGDTGLSPGPMGCSSVFPFTPSGSNCVSALTTVSSQTRMGNCSSRSPDPFWAEVWGQGLPLQSCNQDVPAAFHRLGGLCFPAGDHSPFAGFFTCFWQHEVDATISRVPLPRTAALSPSLFVHLLPMPG